MILRLTSSNWTHNVPLENFRDKPQFLKVALEYVDLEEDLSEKDQKCLIDVIMHQKNRDSLYAAIKGDVKVYNANWRGTTPFHNVEDVDSAKVLFDGGGRLNVPTEKDGFTPVFRAAQEDRSIELFYYFISHEKVNLNHIDDEHRTLEEYVELLANEDNYCECNPYILWGKTPRYPKKCARIKEKQELLRSDRKIREERRELRDCLKDDDTSENKT